jgi:hypothetical protein
LFLAAFVVVVNAATNYTNIKHCYILWYFFPLDIFWQGSYWMICFYLFFCFSSFFLLFFISVKFSQHPVVFEQSRDVLVVGGAFAESEKNQNGIKDWRITRNLPNWLE